MPVAYAAFPHEIISPPREWVEAHYAIERWTEMPRGGHFAALETPELLVDDVRAFFSAQDWGGHERPDAAPPSSPTCATA